MVASDGYRVLKQLIEIQTLVENEQLLTTSEATDFRRGRITALVDVHGLAESIILSTENTRARRTKLADTGTGIRAATGWGHPSFH